MCSHTILHMPARGLLGSPGPGQAGSPQGGTIAPVSATSEPSRF